jgi:class 3 adenylate cyclase
MSAPITRNLTILLTDIKGFTDKTSQKSRAEIQQMLDRHKEIVLPILQGKGGKLVKTIGDAFLMTFESPTDAVLAGVQVQEALRQYNADKTHAEVIEIRIAINQGEVNLSDNDVFGEPVNITARIEAIAEANEVFFTDAVYLAMNKKEVPSSEVGLLQLKGIPEKVRVYKVRREKPLDEERAEVPGPSAKHLWHALNPLAGPAAAVAVAPAGGRAKPRLRRRLGALVIDAALCAVIINLFWPGDTTEVRIKHKSRHSSSAAAPAPQTAPASPASPAPESNEVLTAGKDGFTVKTPDGTVKLGKGGIKLTTPDGKEKDLKVKLGSNGVEVEDAGEEDKDSDDEGTTVSRVRRHKDLRFPLVWFLYSILLMRSLGTTVGGKICKLAVVPMNGNGPLEKRQNLLRAFFSLLSGYCFLLGYIWAFWERDGRGWHDLMAGTRVVDAQ